MGLKSALYDRWREHGEILLFSSQIHYSQFIWVFLQAD